MIEEAIMLYIAADEGQALLWIKKEEETCANSKVVKKDAVYNSQNTIILQESYTALESEVV